MAGSAVAVGTVTAMTSRTVPVRATKRIRPGRARRGDLEFFHGRNGVYHVGLYAGRGHL